MYERTCITIGNRQATNSTGQCSRRSLDGINNENTAQGTAKRILAAELPQAKHWTCTTAPYISPPPVAAVAVVAAAGLQ